MSEAFHARIATPGDEQLLYRLFAEEKAREFAALGLPSVQLDALLGMQFRARQLGYAQSCVAAKDWILCLIDGTAVGRHLVERRPDCYRTIDLAVLDHCRNRGAGAWALRQVQQAADRDGVACTLRVMRNSLALRLYERLGFVPVSGDEISLEMEWRSQTDGAGRE